jgi:hypothetical protein
MLKGRFSVKKIIALLFLLAFIVSLGCGTDTKTTTKPAGSPVTDTKPKT